MASETSKSSTARGREHERANGRERLIEAALRLSAQKSSLGSLGLRELAREAGLNPNTFYRHFADLDALALAAVEHFGEALRRDRNAARDEARDFATFLRGSLARYFAFAAKNPQAFVLGFRELAAQADVSPVSRAVRALMDELSEELLVITRHYGELPHVPLAMQRELSQLVIRQLFMLSLEYIERPRQRAEVLERALRFVGFLHRGAEAAAKPRRKRRREPRLRPAL